MPRDAINGFTPAETTVREVHSAITAGTITAEDLTRWYLEQIEAHDDKINALITVNPDALDRAKQLDVEYSKSGLVGPLHGIPIIVKDNILTNGMPTTGGSTVFKN